MREIQTLAVIGGGSAYTPGLCAGLLGAAAHLPLRALRLYDIEPEHLALVGRLCAAMSRSRGEPLTITTAAAGHGHR